MAKSTGFFSKRRGSAGSLTFSVLNGKQITKEKISSMSNPKTQYQARQRMILSIASKLVAVLRGIVDHSFEGVAYGNKSVNHFQSLAAKDSGNSDFLPIAKGEAGFQPKAVQISQGTLMTLSAKPAEGDDKSIVIRSITGAASAEAFFNANPQLKEGDQLTFVVVVNNSDAVGGGFFPATGNRIVIDRVILNAANLADTGTVVTENDHFQISLDDGTATAEFRSGVEEDVIVACAVIASRKDIAAGKWRRSTETLALTTDYSSTDWQEQYNDDLASFMAAAGVMNSDRYLNQAEDVQEAEVTYTRAAYVSIDNAIAEGSEVGLVVFDSDGVAHGVVGGSESFDDDLICRIPSSLKVPAIQQASPSGADMATPGETRNVLSPDPQWGSVSGAAATVGDPVVLGSRVKYIDVYNFLLAQ